MPEPRSVVPLDGWRDPAELFQNWVARAPHAFWLDAGPGATSGWSYLGIGAPDAQERAFATALDGSGRGGAASDTGPFSAGWVGWIEYEPGAVAAGAPTADDPLAPPSVWLRTQRFIAVDHARRRLWAVAPAADDAWGAQAQTLVTSAATASSAPPEARRARSRHTPDEYAALIERCRDAIREGDAYQLCLTTRFCVSGDIDPVAAYLHLRALIPSHHGGFVRSGDVALLSATPERFLDVAGGIARTSPIKGTRPRSADAAADADLAAELASSAKERAENVMIVDLMRNDLSQVGVPGSIRVERLLEVESYAAVHQLVSTVSATLAEGTTVAHLLHAAFPAGSMTGAPKLSAMTILHRLENGPRGVFAGCFGYIGDDGTIDLAMVIRSIVVHPGGAYVGAGGGITWGSDAAAEVAEVGLKARAPLAAIGAELPGGW